MRLRGLWAFVKGGARSVAERVSDRTDMTFEQALHFEAIRRLDLIRHKFQMMNEALRAQAKYAERVGPLVERMLEEYEDYESWKQGG